MKTLIAVALLSLTTGIADAAHDKEAVPTACTMEYNPVCGTVHGLKKNYSNKCQAETAGATNITPGVCERGHRKHKAK
jgi:hypothetical protein